MCNAWNHHLGCRCGFGGEGHLGRSSGGFRCGYDLRTPAGRERVYRDSFVNPNARCPACGAQVFFYQSPYGGRVYFDALGWPWPKHPCTDSRQACDRLRPADHDRLGNLHFLLRKLGLPTAMAPARPPAPPPPAPTLLDIPLAPPDPQALIAAGNQALVRRNYKHASACFVRALQAQPDLEGAWLGLAAVLRKSGTGTPGERAYCLQRVHDLALAHHHAATADIAARRLARLQGVRPEVPSVLRGFDQSHPAAPGVDQHTAPRAPQSAEWQLLVRTPKGAEAVRWVLIRPGACEEGLAPPGLPPHTAILTALLRGLEVAVLRAGAAPLRLVAGSNAAYVIAMLEGYARVRSAADQELLAAIKEAGQPEQVRFRVMGDNELDRLLQGEQL